MSVKPGIVKWASRAAWPLLRAGGEKTAWQERWSPRAPNRAVRTWIHAASLGEIASLRSLLKPTLGPFGITVTSGRSLDAVRQRFEEIADVRPLPIPRGPGFDALIDAWQPRRLVLLEAEAWPALLNLVPERVPQLAVLGGRMRFPTTQAWRRFFARPGAGEAIAGIWVANETDRRSYLDAGAATYAVHAGYRSKLVDVRPQSADEGFRGWRTGAGLHVVAGSLHPDECDTLGAAWRIARASDPAAKLLIVPRHPERGGEIAKRLQEMQLPVSLWPARAEICVVASYGVLAGLYELADVAAIGGSWNGKGGHNPVEAAVHGIPVVMGPSHENQRDLVEIGAGQIVVAPTPETLAAALLDAKGKARRRDERFSRHTATIRAMAETALTC